MASKIIVGQGVKAPEGQKHLLEGVLYEPYSAGHRALVCGPDGHVFAVQAENLEQKVAQAGFRLATQNDLDGAAARASSGNAAHEAKQKKSAAPKS